MNLGEENEQVEFKKSTSELKEAVYSIAAILNKHGAGDVYFGIRNDGTVVGQNITDHTLREVSQAIRRHIKPVIYPEITKEMIDNRQVVHVKFKGYAQPYLAYNIPRIRVADEDLVMDQDAYADMLRIREDKGRNWEQRESEYQISDVNTGVLKDYLQRAKQVGRITFLEENPTVVLNRLNLVRGSRLLNAGAALFVESNINEIQMAKYASDERLTFTDIRRETGSIFKLVRMAEQYLVDAMDWRVEFNGSMKRVEVPEIPVGALREALVNAFAHRSIESGESIDVAVYRNRIEIYSPGEFPNRLTPQMYIEGNERPIRRNPLITRVLYYSQDMESFATGLKRIQHLCDVAGCKVDYRKDAYGFTVAFSRRKEHHSQVTPQVTPQVVFDDPKIVRLLAFCETPRSLQEMMQCLELTDRKHFRRRYLNPLLESGQLRMTMPNKPRSSLQKYIAVPAGQRE